MKGEKKTVNLQVPSKCSGNDETLFTNLPLLFASGKPVSLEKITLSELEKFIPFMVKCSLGKGICSQKDLNNCPVPDWWPKEDIPFSFPLRGLRSGQKVNCLKSLVCRCYMYYDCEFLLKFSSQLAMMLPSKLKYVRNDDSETTSIYDRSGNLLVKFRNENVLYDAGRYRRKRLFPIIQPGVWTRNKSACIDLTMRSEDYFQDDDFPQKRYCLKRKRHFSQYEKIGNAEYWKKKKTLTTLERDQDDEYCWQPTVLDKDGFVNLFGLQRVGESPKKVLIASKATTSKGKLARRFLILPFSSVRGKNLLASTRMTVNIELHIDRIERHTITDTSDQICTRTTITSNVDDLDGENSDIGDGNEDDWVHTYKWPSKCHNPKRLHRGPVLKACYVKLHKISEECIRSFMSHCFKTVVTMTPEDWRDNPVVCDCSLIPVISFTEDKYSAKTCDKSCSTRCSCKTGNDIRSTHHSPHNMTNIASHFGNTNISNNTNTNQSINNESHTKRYSSTNQRSYLGRTKSNGPVLTEVPNFTIPSSTIFDNSVTMPDKILPYMSLRQGIYRDLPKIKKFTKTSVTKNLFMPTLERASIVPSKNSIVPQNTDSKDNLYVKSRNSNCALQKKIASGLNNGPNLKTKFKKPLHFNVKSLQENLIPNYKPRLTKKRKPRDILLNI